MLLYEPCFIKGHTLLNHVYLKNTISEEFDIAVLMLNIYFSDRDTVRVKLSLDH